MSPVPHTLGTHIARRRRALRINQTAAAEAAHVARSTWVAWEKDNNVPSDTNYAVIEEVCQWQEGSVAAILAGGSPVPRVPGAGGDASNVVPLRPTSEPQDEDEDETIRQLRDAPIGDDLRALLIQGYQAEKARDLRLRRHEDEERRRRYLKIAEAAGE